MQEELFALNQARAEGKDEEDDSLDPAHCPDREKPRATVHQYVSMIAMQVAPNLEGIALAREERNPGSTKATPPCRARTSRRPPVEAPVKTRAPRRARAWSTRARLPRRSERTSSRSRRGVSTGGRTWRTC